MVGIRKARPRHAGRLGHNPDNDPADHAEPTSRTQGARKEDSGRPKSSALVRLAQTGYQTTPLLADILQQFWGVPIYAKFFGASFKPLYFWRGDEFHVSRMLLSDTPPENNEVSSTEKTDAAETAVLRLSKSTCNGLLTAVLGTRPHAESTDVETHEGNFSLTRLSPLEASILNEFSRDLLIGLRRQLFRRTSQNTLSLNTSHRLVHFIWLIQIQPANSDGTSCHPLELGKIILTMPWRAIKAARMLPSPLSEKQAGQPHPESHDFFERFLTHVEAAATLVVGSSPIRMADLSQLEIGDIVVLEQSSSDKMVLLQPEWTQSTTDGNNRQPGDQETSQTFGVTIRQHQAIAIPYEQEPDPMDIRMDAKQDISEGRETLWDNLMIDVTAEFSSIKVPLKQLRQMSEGLVVEMGDLLHNEIALKVDGKKLAHGELIVVGDKFGVRVTALETNGENAPETNPKPPERAPSQAVASTTVEDTASAEAGPPKSKPAATSAQESASAAEEAEAFLNDDFDDAFEDDDW